MTHPRTPGSEGGFPQAPTQEEWDALCDEERKRVVASLPGIEDDRRRLHAGLMEAEELLARLKHTVEGLQQRAKEEARRAEEEARRRQEAEQRVAELQAELDRLKGK